MCRTDALSQKGYFRPQTNAKKGDDANRVLGEVSSEAKL